MNITNVLILGTCFTFSFCASARDWYVDAENGSDATGNGTQGSPYATILAASTNSALNANETIYVAEGVYSNGWYELSGLKTRVYCSRTVKFKATGRRAFTHIVGAWDPEGDEHGRGPNAIRCAATAAATWEGFTFRDGSTLVGSSETASNPYIGGGALGGTLIDCVVSNCCAYKGGGVRNIVAVRTLVADCWSSGGGDAASGGTAYFCVFANNHGVSVTSSTPTYNCTYVGNGSGSTHAGSVQAYNCLLAGNVGGISTSCTDSTGSISTGVSSFPLMAPVFGDYRIVAGSRAAGCADRSKFSATYTVDFAGNEIPESGDLNVGAIAVGTVTPAAGCVYVNGAASFEGAPLMTDNASWAYPESYPTQFCVKPIAKGKHLMRITPSRTDGTCLYPTIKDEFFLMPHPTAATTNSVTWASKVYYVDPHEGVGSDDNSGTSPESPFQTIGKALSLVAKSASVIYCAAGDYTKGGNTLVQQGSYSVTNVVNCDSADFNVFIRGKGAGVSFITGAPDPTTGGRGTYATRPVALFSTTAALQGFTLRNGYGDTNATGASGDGVYMRTGNDGSRSQVLDSEIIGHVGRRVVDAGQFVRCRFAGNTAASNLINAQLESCLVAGNDFNSSNSMLPGYKIYGSTVVGKTQDTTLFASSGVSVYGSVLSRVSSLNVNNTYRGVIAGTVKYPTSGSTDVVYADPLFVNEGNSDYRLMGDTPAKNVEFASSEWTDTVRLHLGPDINGVRRSLTANGFLPGAYEQTVGSSFTIDGKGVLLNGVEPTGRYTLGEGESAVITRDESKETIAVGVEVNGKTYRFAETPAVTISSADILAAGGVLSVLVIEATDWYVSVSTGDDKTGNGIDPMRPFKTFARVLTNANLKAGHTVHVAEGVYNIDKMTDGGLFARAVIPSGVTMVADGAVENTIIEGADAPIPDARGLGAGAVRCVRLAGANSRIRGFTLRGGRTMPPSATETNAEKTGDNYTGGGARGTGTTGLTTMVVEDCILTDCAANRGGAAAYCMLKNCRVTANVSVNRGAAGLNVSAFGCLFDDHTTKTDVLMYPYSVVNCTFGPGNDASLYAATFSAGTWEFVNNIVFCNVTMASTVATNSIFTLSKYRGSAFLGEGCVVTNAEALCLADNLRPTAASDLIVDRGGDFALLANLTDKDASGGQRIYNGTVDIGALEYDWRGQFARRMRTRSRRGFVVAAASSGVQDATDGVTMTDGETLKVDWTVDEASAAGFSVAVNGEGSLSVKVNGENVPVQDGVCAFNLVAGTNVVEIAFAGTGTVTVGGFFGAEKGMLLIVR